MLFECHMLFHKAHSIDSTIGIVLPKSIREHHAPGAGLLNVVREMLG